MNLLDYGGPKLLEDKRFYVYGLWRENESMPFYIGKGVGYRYQQSKCVYRTTNKHKINIIKKYKKLGLKIVSKILHSNLSEKEAFKREIILIKQYGKESNKGYLVNLTDGGNGATGIEITKKIREKIKKKAIVRNNLTYVLLSPDLKLHVTNNLKDFSNKYNLDHSGLSKTANSKYRQYVGWRCKKISGKVFIKDITEKDLIKFFGKDYKNFRYVSRNLIESNDIKYIAISPNNQIYKIKSHELDKFLKEHDLKRQSIIQLCNNKDTRKSTVGWRFKKINKNISDKILFSNKYLETLFGKDYKNFKYIEKRYLIISPNSIVFITGNLTEFCKSNKLNIECLRSVCKGLYKHHDGWRCKKVTNNFSDSFLLSDEYLKKVFGNNYKEFEDIKKYLAYILLSPNKEFFVILHKDKKLTKFCKDNGLTLSNILGVIRGTSFQHRGWIARKIDIRNYNSIYELLDVNHKIWKSIQKK